MLNHQLSSRVATIDQGAESKHIDQQCGKAKQQRSCPGHCSMLGTMLMHTNTGGALLLREEWLEGKLQTRGTPAMLEPWNLGTWCYIDRARPRINLGSCCLVVETQVMRRAQGQDLERMRKTRKS
jgi:hypothetical protein